jgi:hypothetical protein
VLKLGLMYVQSEKLKTSARDALFIPSIPHTKNNVSSVSGQNSWEVNTDTQASKKYSVSYKTEWIRQFKIVK